MDRRRLRVPAHQHRPRNQATSPFQERGTTQYDDRHQTKRQEGPHRRQRASFVRERGVFDVKAWQGPKGTAEHHDNWTAKPKLVVTERGIEGIRNIFHLLFPFWCGISSIWRLRRRFVPASLLSTALLRSALLNSVQLSSGQPWTTQGHARVSSTHDLGRGSGASTYTVCIRLDAFFSSFLLG